MLSFDDALSRFGMDGLLRRAGVCVLGYSGGADSSCLLRLLRDWCEKNSVTLAAAHVNHGIRGDEADRDEDFCRASCESLGIPFFSRRYDVPAIAKERGLGMEEAARQVRYSFFDEVSAELTGSADGAVIATAHNATDNLETVLFHIMRGTGLRGLCGIPPVRDERFIRPLILTSSAAVREWCAENSVSYVTDRTNLDSGYTRNDLRLNVLPELSRMFADPESSAARMTGLLRMDEDCLDSEARSHVRENAREIARDELNALHPAIGSRVLRLLAANAGDKVPEEGHIREIMRLARDNPGESRVDLPGALVCEILRDRVQIVPKGKGSSAQSPAVFRYPEDGVCYSNDLCTVIFSPNGKPDKKQILQTNGFLYPEENIYKLSISVSLTFDKIMGALQVRVRQPGDVLRFGGMTHKVGTLFSDRKLPSEDRAQTPILADEDGIVWIPGFPPRDGLRWNGTGERLDVVCIYRQKNNTEFNTISED